MASFDLTTFNYSFKYLKFLDKCFTFGNTVFNEQYLFCIFPFIFQQKFLV